MVKYVLTFLVNANCRKLCFTYTLTHSVLIVWLPIQKRCMTEGDDESDSTTGRQQLRTKDLSPNPLLQSGNSHTNPAHSTKLLHFILNTNHLFSSTLNDFIKDVLASRELRHPNNTHPRPLRRSGHWEGRLRTEEISLWPLLVLTKVHLSEVTYRACRQETFVAVTSRID